MSRIYLFNVNFAMRNKDWLATDFFQTRKNSYKLRVKLFFLHYIGIENLHDSLEVRENSANNCEIKGKFVNDSHICELYFFRLVCIFLK